MRRLSSYIPVDPAPAAGHEATRSVNTAGADRAERRTRSARGTPDTTLKAHGSTQESGEALLTTHDSSLDAAAWSGVAAPLDRSVAEKQPRAWPSAPTVPLAKTREPNVAHPSTEPDTCPPIARHQAPVLRRASTSLPLQRASSPALSQCEANEIQSGASSSCSPSRECRRTLHRCTSRAPSARPCAHSRPLAARPRRSPPRAFP